MILNVQNMTFSYNSHPTLQDVNFQVQAGELVAILGPNGVGKTTLLKCLNAIHRPKSGTILVEGKDVLKLNTLEVARRIGYVSQRIETARLTVFDAVLLGRRPHIRWQPMKKDLKIVDAALDSTGLKLMSMRFMDELSGGELQKVAIARAIVQDPKLMLLDEPTSSLDLKNQMEVLKLIRSIVDNHPVSAIMTMHDLNCALRFAHKYLFLKNGQIHSVGEPKEVTGDMIEKVYGLPVMVHRHEGCPYIMPIN